MISFNMKISIFLLFTILTVLQAEFQYGNKYSRYEIGNSDENNHETHLSSKINLEPEYNDDDEDTHFHTKVKVVCCHGQTVCPKKLKKRMNYSDRAEVNRRNRTSRSSKKAGRGKRSSRRMNNKMKKEYEEDRELVQAKEVSEFESEMNNSRFGKEYSLLAKGGHGEYQSTTYNGAKHKEFAENISGKLNRAYVNQKSEREIYSNKRLGKSNQKVLNEDFDDDTLGTIIGPESASTSLNGEDGNGVNSGDKEYGNNKNVLNEDFDDDTLGTIIGPESASPSLYGKRDGHCPYKSCPCGGCKKCGGCTILGCKCNDFKGLQEGRDFGGSKGNSLKAVRNNSYSKTSETSIGTERESPSLYSEADKRSASGCPYKKCPCGGCKECGGCTILGCKCNDFKGLQEGRDFDGSKGNSLNAVRNNSYSKTSGTSIGPERDSSSLYSEADKRSASGCPYKKCPCGGCKKCGGCTILGCKCNGFNGMQEGRGFGGSVGDNQQFVRKSVAVKKPVTTSRPFGWHLYR